MKCGTCGMEIVTTEVEPIKFTRCPSCGADPYKKLVGVFITPPPLCPEDLVEAQKIIQSHKPVQSIPMSEDEFRHIAEILNGDKAGCGER